MHDLDPRLLEAFAPIRRDLHSAGLRASLRPAPPYLTAAHKCCGLLFVNGISLQPVQLDPEGDSEQHVGWVAEQVQDHVLEFVRCGSQATVWPRCKTGHTHPMVIRRTPGPPCWVCPHDREHRCPLGSVPVHPPSQAHPSHGATPRAPTAGTRTRTTGTVKYYLDAKGYGFITLDGTGEDLFCLFSAIDVPGYKSLTDGQKVELEVDRRSDTLVYAAKVRPVP